MKNKILKGIATLMAAVMLIGTAAVIPAQEVEAWIRPDDFQTWYSPSYYGGRTWELLTESDKWVWYNDVVVNHNWHGIYDPTWSYYPAYPYSYYNGNYYYYNNIVSSSSNSSYDPTTYPGSNAAWSDLTYSQKWDWVNWYYGYRYSYYDPYYFGYYDPYYSYTLNIVSTDTNKKPAKTDDNSKKATYMSSALVEKVLKLVKSCESGENVTITMGKTTHIDSDIMAALQGRNITVYAKKGSYSWFINGKDIKDSSIDANVACTVNAGNIPEKLTKKFKGEKVELSTVANNLTFKGYLYASIGSEGDKVEVYKYDGEALNKIATVTVDSDDEAGVKISAGGDYLFVVK